MYYFANGSNIDDKSMKKLDVDFISREFGILVGYKLVLNKKASRADFT